MRIPLTPLRSGRRLHEQKPMRGKQRQGFCQQAERMGRTSPGKEREP